MQVYTATSLKSLIYSTWTNRQLITQMITRDVIGKYKGSLIGIVWSLLNPLLMLATYTFVFSVVFKARFHYLGTESKIDYAFFLFIGMILHGLLSESLMRAPTLILCNANYVKKIVFPLEILPLVATFTSFFHGIISIFVLLVALLLYKGFIPFTFLLLPLILLPLFLLTLGLAWALASLGVFLRDVAQPIGILMTVLLFTSPVFYSLDAVPEDLHLWIMLNPITYALEQARNVLFYGMYPDFYGMLLYTAISILIAWVGYFWFQKTRKGFANVI